MKVAKDNKFTKLFKFYLNDFVNESRKGLGNRQRFPII